MKDKPVSQIFDESSLEKFSNYLYQPNIVNSFNNNPYSFIQNRQVTLFKKDNFEFNYENKRRQR